MPPSTQHEHGLALENATRRDQGLPELTLEQYIAAGYRYPDQSPPATTHEASTPALDVGAIYRTLNTPTAAPARDASAGERAERSSRVPDVDAHAAGEAFAASIFARANARHGTVPRTAEDAGR